MEFQAAPFLSSCHFHKISRHLTAQGNSGENLAVTISVGGGPPCLPRGGHLVVKGGKLGKDDEIGINLGGTSTYISRNCSEWKSPPGHPEAN